ncbi:DUF11 domain-containing protein [Tenacibaculum sp. 190130A14a]|uniref:DUF11 domain-containing protein n=1 Tax=Tenacibaculum polynesiense TaxID=3137857 RepID=A0ABM9PAF2_9FLAO
MKKILILLLFLSLTAFAQTGPGGVGARDGSSTLRVWLRANDVNADGDISNNPTVGSTVSAWNDFSGNGNNYTNSSATRSPSYASTPFGSVNFNAATNPAQVLNANTGGTYTDASAFFAINPVNVGSSNSLFDNTSYSLRIEQWSNTNRIGLTRYGVADYSSSLIPQFNSNTIVSYHKNSSSSNVTIYSNNSVATINIGSSSAGIPYDRIGRNSNGADEASGDFYEIILYNSRLNTAERVIVENYLSAKFGSISVSDNVYNEDENGDFDHKVAGIGQAPDGSNHLDSQGTGIVRINGPSDIDNNEYLIWGENVEDSDYAFTQVGKRYRVNTVWRVSERGDLEDVSAAISQSDLDLTGVPTGVFKLVRSTVADFSTIAEEYDLSLAGGTYSGTVSFDDNDYFTLMVVPSVDLKLTKTVDTAIPKVGDVVTFSLSITNSGPQSATGVQVRDLLPTGLTYNAGSSTIGTGTYNQVSGLWDLSGVTITSGQTITVQIAATVASAGTIINTGEVINVDQEDIDSDSVE